MDENDKSEEAKKEAETEITDEDIEEDIKEEKQRRTLTEIGLSAAIILWWILFPTIGYLAINAITAILPTSAYILFIDFPLRDLAFLVLIIVLIALEIRYIYKSWGFISYRPPYVGLGVIWGKRKVKIVKKEGWILIADYFPFNYTVTLIKVQKIDKDFTFSDIRTKAKEEEKDSKLPSRSGALVEVDVSLTFIPDYKGKDAGERLKSYLNSGEAEGVINIIQDQIAEELRILGGKHDWEEYTFSATEIKRVLLEKLTGADINGAKDEKEKAKRQRKIEREIRISGARDVSDLGIRICRLNIGQIDLPKNSSMKKEADSLERERQKRQGDTIQMNFLEEQVRKFIALGLSPGEASDVVQTQLKMAGKNINTFRGLEGSKGKDGQSQGITPNIIAIVEDKVRTSKEKTKKKDEDEEENE
ncbi:MAG: SPFH domain-containing protein [Candidatus Nealsonbacteria bacterium]|nr:SPFH domain-containing protein [Candidatus Nealsonbacteria bacterium]